MLAVISSSVRANNAVISPATRYAQERRNQLIGISSSIPRHPTWKFPELDRNLILSRKSRRSDNRLLFELSKANATVWSVTSTSNFALQKRKSMLFFDAQLRAQDQTSLPSVF